MNRIRKTTFLKGRQTAGLTICIAITAALVATINSRSAQAQNQRWCGTDSSGPLGALSALIPQSFPRKQKAGQCGGRVAKLWKACRAHDVCYWNLNVPIETCQARFRPNLVAQCRQAFAQGRRARTDATCEAMFNECARLASTFDFVVGKYDRLTGTAEDARAEARRTVRRLKQLVGAGKIRARRRFAYNRIAHYCARIKVANACDHNRVARIVADEL